MDPDPHGTSSFRQSESASVNNQDADPHPHQSVKLDPVPDPNPHHFADDKPKCMEYEPI